MSTSGPSSSRKGPFPIPNGTEPRKVVELNATSASTIEPLMSKLGLENAEASDTTIHQNETEAKTSAKKAERYKKWRAAQKQKKKSKPGPATVPAPRPAVSAPASTPARDQNSGNDVPRSQQLEAGGSGSGVQGPSLRTPVIRPTGDPGQPVPGAQQSRNCPKQNFLKIYAVYRCSNDHAWKSMHGWKEARYVAYCDYCDTGRGTITRNIDEMCTFDVFSCECGSTWQSLHSEHNNGEACEDCDAVVRRAGTQERYATHYSYRCNNQGCGIEWEEAYYLGVKFTQRCRKCNQRGEMIRTGRETQAEHDQRMKQRAYSDVGGTHNVDGCDMCQKIIGERKGRSCKRANKVEIAVTVTQNGDSTSRIIGIC